MITNTSFKKQEVAPWGEQGAIDEVLPTGLRFVFGFGVGG